MRKSVGRVQAECKHCVGKAGGFFLIIKGLIDKSDGMRVF